MAGQQGVKERLPPRCLTPSYRQEDPLPPVSAVRLQQELAPPPGGGGLCHVGSPQRALGVAQQRAAGSPPPKAPCPCFRPHVPGSCPAGPFADMLQTQILQSKARPRDSQDSPSREGSRPAPSATCQELRVWGGAQDQPCSRLARPRPPATLRPQAAPSLAYRVFGRGQGERKGGAALGAVAKSSAHVPYFRLISLARQVAASTALMAAARSPPRSSACSP